MKRLIKNSIICFLTLVCFIQANAQRIIKKTEAIRSYSNIKINGLADEEIWSKCPVASDFYQFQPINGKPSKFNTEVKICYDNSAIYIFARMYDPYPDSIPKELGVRDEQELNADYFNISINPFNDGIHEFVFAVTSSGIQLDFKSTSGEYDETWDAVWQSAVNIDSLGWCAEIEIPHAAIRFPKTLGKPWGVNFWRAHQRSQEISCWNKVDNSNSESGNQSGEITGFTSIVPPLRLSFMPYISMYLNHYPYNIVGKENMSTSINGGMDVKFGINESFTLDMTLIPDFGQVQSDEVVLNLTPFEIKYEDKRPFFTEATELFSKADLFYSRRIGSIPIDYFNIQNKLSDKDSIVKNPIETQLINATKLSGRTAKGLGIGLFNAISGNCYAEVQDKYGNKRQMLTQALTNYNIIVLDQVFKKNSYVSLVNTNAYYDKGGRMANVSGTEFKLANKNNSFAVFGNAALSEKFDSVNSNALSGFKTNISYGKISGRFKFSLTQSILSNHYDVNDLGFLEFNNSLQNTAVVNYNFYNPFYKFMSLLNELRLDHSNQYMPYHFENFELKTTTTATLKDFSTLTVMLDLIPFENYDFFEPRIQGRYLRKSSSWWVYTLFSSNIRKKVIWEANAGYLNGKGDFKDSFWWDAGPKFRFSNRFSISYNLSIDHEWHDIGFAAFDLTNTNHVYMGKRDVRRIENNIGLNYIFSKSVSLKLVSRHYWSTVDYQSFYDLQNDGSITPSAFNQNLNNSFNAFNVDFLFSWRFAPGSELNFVWKNQILTSDNKTFIPFSENFTNTLKSDQMNSISLKISYYLDYHYLRKKASIK